ncbi:hypothetical protein ES703_17428 [subsurface metagenome]
MEGRLQIRNYEDKDGVKRRVAEVVAWSVQFLQRLKKQPLPEIPEEKGENQIDKIPLPEEKGESLET